MSFPEVKQQHFQLAGDYKTSIDTGTEEDAKVGSKFQRMAHKTQVISVKLNYSINNCSQPWFVSFNNKNKSIQSIIVKRYSI